MNWSNNRSCREEVNRWTLSFQIGGGKPAPDGFPLPVGTLKAMVSLPAPGDQAAMSLLPTGGSNAVRGSSPGAEAGRQQEQTGDHQQGRAVNGRVFEPGPSRPGETGLG